MKPKKKLEYKWVIVALCFMMVMVTLGFCSSNKALYLGAITDALDIQRSAFSLGDSIRFIVSALINILFGTMVRKFGTKKLIGAGFACLIGFAVLYATTDHIIGFYLGSALLGIGTSWTTTTMVGWVVGKWCKENKGTIMGAVLAANGLGGAAAAQIVTPIIYQEGNPFGYRTAYWIVAAILLAAGTLMMILYKEKPKEPGDHIPHAKKKKRGQSWTGLEFSRVKKMPYFYVALICCFMTGLILQGINGVSAAHMKDVGLSTTYLATVMSVHSLALTACKFSVGFIYDKVGLRFTMTLCQLSAFAAMISLALTSPTGIGPIAAMGYSIISCLALPLETIMLPIFASDLFGDLSFDKTLGIFVAVNTAGYAVGAPLANVVFDHFGTYTPMLYISAILMIVVTVASQYFVSAAHKIRKKQEALEEANA